MGVTEAVLQQQVADYLRLQYPNVLFHSDFGSGIKLTMGQAVKQKRQNGGRRAWPDMFIAEPKGVKALCKVIETNGSKEELTGDDFVDAMGAYFIQQKYGLFIELKKEGTRLKKKNGEWASEHIAEQAEILERLEFRGYRAVFAVGFDEAKEVIDEYMTN